MPGLIVSLGMESVSFPNSQDPCVNREQITIPGRCLTITAKALKKGKKPKPFSLFQPLLEYT